MKDDAKKLAQEKGAVTYRTFTGPLWPGQKEQYEFVEIMRSNPPGMIMLQYFRPAQTAQPFVVVDGSTAYFSMKEFNQWKKQRDVKIVERAVT